MQLFKWSRAHAVFLPQVDAEHRNLFRLAEELHQAVEARARAPRILNEIQALLEAVEEHFSHEERLMKAAACESYEWHKRQHNTLRRKGRRMCAAFAAGDRNAPEDFLAFLAHWFRDHVALTDRMMGAQLRNSDRLAAKAS
jgi:hemerythrin-like metal-binding protein